jgi:sugar phosphate isomerase/epimerase
VLGNEITRRALLGGAALFAATRLRAETQAQDFRISIFSKHLQFLDGEALAQATAQIGFDGIDLTVRRGGHVEPERVRHDLPRLAELIRKNHLEISMVTTDIVDATSPFAEDVLRTMQTLGIRYYRWGGFKYDYSQPLALQLEALKPRIANLSQLNRRYGTTAIYHTHSGVGMVGASIWDLHIILKDFDPHYVAINYDIAHATIEGGLGGWINSFDIAKPHIRGIAVKDFIWSKVAGSQWKAEFVPLGTGMVHLPKFIRMVKQSGFSGPLQLHFEYPLGGSQDGVRKLTIDQADVFNAMKRDLQVLRQTIRESRS